MIIVSQDKNAIHNFDNILSLQIEPCDGCYDIYVYDALNDNTSLGEYKTEERAKEVLKEIVEKYREGISTCRMGEGEWAHCKNVYEMPEA